MIAVCGSSYLSATRREACVTAQPPLQVVSALSMSAQVDGSGLDVDVHQVVDNLTLDVILDAVDEVAPSHVYHLNEGKLPGGREHRGCSEQLQVRLINSIVIYTDHLPVMLIRVQRLVAGFVTFNSLLEIQHSFSLVTVPVVWTRHLHFLHRRRGL